MSVALILVGLMVGLIIRSGSTNAPSDCYVQTKAQLAKVSVALDSFVRRNNRYPVPAGRGFGVSDPQFGHEATLAANIDEFSSGTPLLFGALPFQALGLSSDAYAADCWGNKLTYVVTKALTTASGFAGGASGGIVIHSGQVGSATTLLNDAAYAVISHGEDGYGAVAKSYAGSGHGWMPYTTNIDSENSNFGNPDLYTATYNRNPGLTHFDDVIVYFGKRNSNCNGPSYPVIWDSCSANVAGPLSNTQSVLVNDITDPSDYAHAICLNGAVAIDGSQPTSCGGCSHSGPGGGGGVCTASSCATATLSWGASNQCSASFAGVGNGTTSPPTTNGAPGYSGSATATCTTGTWAVDPGAICTP